MICSSVFTEHEQFTRRMICSSVFTEHAQFTRRMICSSDFTEHAQFASIDSNAKSKKIRYKVILEITLIIDNCKSTEEGG